MVSQMKAFERVQYFFDWILSCAIRPEYRKWVIGHKRILSKRKKYNATVREIPGSYYAI